MWSALAEGSNPSTSRAADGRRHDDEHDGHADEAAAAAAAAGHGDGGGGGGGGVDAGDDGDDDEVDVVAGGELAGWVAPWLTDEETVIATDAAFPSAFKLFVFETRFGHCQQ